MRYCPDCMLVLTSGGSHCGTCKFPHCGFVDLEPTQDAKPERSTTPAINALLRLLDSDDERIALQAARALLDYGYME